MKSHVAIDNPIRWKLFNLNRLNRMMGEHIDYCPCGTRGSCDSCAGPATELYDRWMAVLHPFCWLWNKIAVELP